MASATARYHLRQGYGMVADTGRKQEASGEVVCRFLKVVSIMNLKVQPQRVVLWIENIKMKSFIFGPVHIEINQFQAGIIMRRIHHQPQAAASVGCILGADLWKLAAFPFD